MLLGDNMRDTHIKSKDAHEIIAANIKEYRKKAKITQAELAERTHFSHEFIRRIEAPNSKKYFSLDTLVQIAKALDVRIEELVKGINSEDK